MNTKKILSMTLAAALLVGGTFLGTKALFSDTKTSTNTLTLTTGKVQIHVREGEWVRNAVDVDENGYIDTRDLSAEVNRGCEKNTTGVFKNVQPGDTFTRYINVLSPDSTYNVQIGAQIKDLSPDAEHENLRKYISINDKSLKSIGVIPAHTNTGGYITVKILDNDEASKALNGAITFNINAIYDITATQVENNQNQQ